MYISLQMIEKMSVVHLKDGRLVAWGGGGPSPLLTTFLDAPTAVIAKYKSKISTHRVSD